MTAYVKVCFVVIALASVAAAAPAVKQLALVCNNAFPKDTDFGPSLKEFQGRISIALALPAENITLSAVLLGFRLKTSNGAVIDSVSTKDAYAIYVAKWKDALSKGGKLVEPFKLGSTDVVVNKDVYEVATGGYDVVEGKDPTVPSTTTRNDLITAMRQRYDVLQLRLKNTSFDSFGNSYKDFDTAISGIRKAAAAVLGIPDTRIMIFNIKIDSKTSVVIQFTVYPASNADLSAFSKKWADALAAKAPAIANTFKDVDFTYPPTELTGVTTTPSPHDGAGSGSSSNAGVVAGSVVGAVAAAGVLGGAGYYYKKRLDAKKQEAGGVDQNGECSPGADGISPNGLHNVNIQGETTPNPHNFRH